MSALLEVAGLGVRFRTRHGVVQALSDATFSVGRGEVLVLVGESGSGKTVLAHALLGLLPRNAEVSGSVRLAGEELVGASERRLRALRAGEVALVPQGAATALNPVHRVERQVDRAAAYRDRPAAELRERVGGRLDRLGLPWSGIRRRYPHQLSGGMAQRVVTTLATATGPGLVLADEPTHGLDADLVSETARQLLDLRTTGSALVVITHDLRLARQLGGRLAVLYASHLVELRDTADVLDDPAHPYSRGLVGALPERGGRPIPGLPPRLDALPPGCPFAPRCPEHRPVCDEQVPASHPVPSGEARCVLHAAC